MSGFRLAVVMVLAIVVGLLPAAEAGAATPPNVVVVVTDDMRTSDWQALPKTQALLAGGTSFPNFFLTTPTCCPSRTSILTGQYAHNHGVLTNEDGGAATGGITAFRKRGLADETIAHALKAAGYRTAIVGKFLNGYDEGDPPVGNWDRWVVPAENSYTDYGLNVDGKARQETGYSTDLFRDEAVKFIEQTSRRKPLFLYFTPKAPHGPSTPAARHRDEFRDARVDKVGAFDEEDVSDKPEYVARKDRLGKKAEQRLDRMERDRLASLLAVDEAVAALVETLQREGRLENTYIFVLSDNGYLMGQHRMEGKGAPYDASVRVPMLAWGPAFGQGKDERVVANIDLAPTIAQIADIPFPAADGQSLLNPDARQGILLERFKDGAKPTYRAVRTQRHLYVEYDTGEKELYDYQDDPAEKENVLADTIERTSKAKDTNKGKGNGKGKGKGKGNDKGSGRISANERAIASELSRLLADLVACRGEECRAAGSGR